MCHIDQEKKRFKIDQNTVFFGFEKSFTLESLFEDSGNEQEFLGFHGPVHNLDDIFADSDNEEDFLGFY